MEVEKKILFIIHNMEGGGAEKMMVRIMNGFVASDITVDLLLGEKTGYHLSSIHPSITVNSIGSRMFFTYLWYMPFYFRKKKYTHIITVGHYISAAGILSRSLARVSSKVYSTHHFTYPEKRELKYWKGDLVLKTLYFFTFPSADKIIAVSKGSLAWLRKFSHRKLPRGIHIYNPAVDDSIVVKAKEPLQFPVDVKGKRILLTAGRLNVEKDHFTLIKAFSLYRQVNRASILFILGVGPLEKQIRNYIKELNCENDVHLVGYDENPYKWMAACDVFVLSSQFEGFGNVIAEAMALGKTIVSTDCPSGPGEILERGKFGYLCPVGDAEKMALAIEQAIRFPINKDKLVEASSKYHEKIVVQQYINIL